MLYSFFHIKFNIPKHPQKLNAMQGDLLSYLKKRYAGSEIEKKIEGPVITISREYGCQAKYIADKVAALLSERADRKGIKHNWKWYSKEILEESAKQLQLEPEQIEYVFGYIKKTTWDDIMSSFSQKYYKSDRKIRTTIAKVIRDIAIQGHSVIVGRGGIAITRDMEYSLHVSLEAPLDWRATRMSAINNLSIEAARKEALEIDKKRKEFRDFFEGKDNDYTRPDIVFNTMTLSEDEIAESIVQLAEKRGFVI